MTSLRRGSLPTAYSINSPSSSAKLAERSHRGKMRKAKEEHVGVTTPKYDFRYNEARDGLIVCEPEMKVVEKVFHNGGRGARRDGD